MDFGTWLRNQRGQTKLTDLATLTGVDASTISRIENGRTEPTIDTVIRLCEGMDVELEYMFRDMLGEDVINKSQENLVEMEIPVFDVPKLDDVLLFLKFFAHEGWESACLILADLLNQSRDGVLKALPESNAIYFKELMNWPEITAVEVYRSIISDPILSQEIAYPSDYGALWVIVNYHNDGCVTFSEAGIFLREIRKSKSLTLSSMQESMSRSASLLSRMEGGVTGRIKLSSVIELNNTLGENFNVIGIYVSASRFYHDIAQQEKSLGLGNIPAKEIAETFLTICRWMQVQSPNRKWLGRLRSRLEL